VAETQPAHAALNAAPETARILAVVLNYRTADLAIACLRSIATQAPLLPNMRVVVTDNASGDGSIDRLASAIRDEGMSGWAELMPLPTNGGYAYGNNAAVRRALASADPPEYVLLLNPDTVLRPNAIQALVSFMRAHPDAGIAGSRLEDPDGTPQCSAFNFPSAWSELDRGLRLGIVARVLEDKLVQKPIPDRVCRVDWVAGASMLVRREVFEHVGLIDEAYFLYFEEVDFLLRAKRAGFETYYVPESRVMHHVGASTGVSDERRAAKRVPGYWFDSRRRYFLKNHGPLGAAAADVAWLLGFGLHSLRQRIKPKPANDPPHVLEDFVRNGVWRRGVSIEPARTD
jgi:N-acetylglucosaminyl-diphospho-decaprenol L-rhamnosyltransferase